MCDVFISYSVKDMDEAEMIRQILESNEISCWIAPRNIPGGSNYAQEIPKAIRNCKIFLLILSSNAQASVWVPRELDRAINCQKVIIPFMVEDFPIGDVFDFYLTGYQRYEAFEKTSDVIQLLIHRIKALLGNTPNSKDTAAHSSSAKFVSAPAKEEAAPNRKKTSLQYDGLYYTAETGGFRTYYRFYPDGKMVSAYTCAAPAQVKTWLNLEKYEGGSAAYKGETLEVIEPVSDGHVYRATATILDNKLILSGFNTYSQRAYDVACDFLSFDQMNEISPNKPEAAPKQSPPVDSKPKINTPKNKPALKNINHSLRCDGYYYSPIEDGDRIFYRFYPNGTVFVFKLPDNISLELVKTTGHTKFIGDRGNYSVLSDNALHIETRNYIGKVDSVDGFLADGTLFIDDCFETVEYHFMPFD